MWRNHFPQSFYVHFVSDIRQREKYTAEPLVLEPSAFEVETAIEKLKRHKSPGTDQIPGEMIAAGGRKIHSEIHKLIKYIWNKKELPEEWKGLIIVLIYKKGDKTDCISCTGISILSTTHKILSNIMLPI
jgi:mannosyltransferase OCH1-like enzyme